MKSHFGIAKNEIIEILLATAFFTFGGFLLGIYQNDPSNYTVIPLSFTVMFFGMIFEMRVLNKFRNEIQDTKDEINHAQVELQQTIRDLHNTATEVNRARQELARTTIELQNTKRELDKAERKMKEVEEKVFGHSMTFAKSSRVNPLDKTVDELKREVAEIKRKLDRMNRDRSSIF
jgi:ABC-type bacteriocin/lantibiotic exporter with double-glycine peptidase domain